jgi:2-polyprenyl-3-methyl-5-hydroxy-6-metoxy-1,4-benzoquinol methylase
VRPRELHADYQIAAIANSLPRPPANVLDVGCGRGFLASVLRGAGYDVTAIDPDTDAVEAARARGVGAVRSGLSEFEGAGFDAVIFSRSLHHIEDLSDAVDRAAHLLDDQGCLVVDEFDWGAADESTAAWFYGTSHLLTVACVIECASDDEEELSGPLARWSAEHADLHTGIDMLDAVGARFDLVDSARLEGLWVYLCQELDDTDEGGRVAEALRSLERDLLSAGTLAPVGLRLTARKRR